MQTKEKARHACGGRARLHIDVQFSIDRDRRPHPADTYDVPDYADRKIEVAPLLRLIREQDAFRPCREPIAETCDLGDRDGDRNWFSDRVRVSLGHVHSTCSGSGLASVIPTPASARSRGRERPYVARSREGCGGLSVGPGPSAFVFAAALAKSRARRLSSGAFRDASFCNLLKTSRNFASRRRRRCRPARWIGGETPLPDLVPMLQKNRNVTVAIRDPLGTVGMLFFNHLHPPFNDVRARRAILTAILTARRLRHNWRMTRAYSSHCFDCACRRHLCCQLLSTRSSARSRFMSSIRTS